MQPDGVSVTVRFTGALPSITTVAETVALNVVDAAARTATVLMTLFEPSQMSPISPLTSSYQPLPGIGSVIGSHNSCDAMTVMESNTVPANSQPGQSPYGTTAYNKLPS